MATVGTKQVVVVTGGARGIGFECARRLAGGGAAVAILDLDHDEATAAARSLEQVSGVCVAYRVDVTREEEVTETIEHVTADIGAPSILVNTAGLLRRTRFLDISVAEWNSVIDVSLKGTFLCSQACLRLMIPSRWGRIINFSSTAGKSVSTLGGAHYTAAKAAVLGLTRAMAKEVAGFGISVNAVCPGLIDTQMVHEFCDEETLRQYASSFPIPRLGRPQEVAALVEFLCSDDAAYITGAALDINGGDLMI